MRIWYQSEVLKSCRSVGWSRDRETKDKIQTESAEGWGKGWVAKLVPDICVSISDEPEDMEAECQEPSAKQVSQSSQVWDGEVVWVQATAPHPVHHPVCDVQENQHLETEGPACSHHPLQRSQRPPDYTIQCITRLGQAQCWGWDSLPSHPSNLSLFFHPIVTNWKNESSLENKLLLLGLLPSVQHSASKFTKPGASSLKSYPCRNLAFLLLILGHSNSCQVGLSRSLAGGWHLDSAFPTQIFFFWAEWDKGLFEAATGTTVWANWLSPNPSHSAVVKECKVNICPSKIKWSTTQTMYSNSKYILGHLLLSFICALGYIPWLQIIKNDLDRLLLMGPELTALTVTGGLSEMQKQRLHAQTLESESAF